MDAGIAGDLDEPTSLKVDLVPAVLLEDLKMDGGPLDFCYFGFGDQLKVNR